MSVAARERLASSAIGEVIALVERHGALSFGAGEPSADLFPKEELREAVCEAFGEPDVWGYFHDEYGFPPLREWIVDRMRQDGMVPDWVRREDVLVTNGGGEGVSLVSEALIDPGSVVLVESPTYVESLLTFRKQGATCIPVPSDDEGILPEELERLARTSSPRFLYTIPNFQNPSGRTLSLERRVRILEVLRRVGVPLLEDDPYHYLSYDADPLPSFLSLAGEDRRVIHCSSFSKIVAPGVRVGWLVVPPALRSTLLYLRVSAGLGRPLVLQRGLWGYLSRLDFPARVEQIRDAYRRRRDVMLEGVATHLAPLGIRTNRPAGGFFIWAESPDDRDMGAFVRHAVEHHKIGIIPGSCFFPQGDRGGDRAFRLSYAKVPVGHVEEGMRRLAEAWRTFRGA